MTEKCDFTEMEMCDRAKDSGIITFGISITNGFAATIVGSGLKIDYCPYCGSSLKDFKLIMKPIFSRGLNFKYKIDTMRLENFFVTQEEAIGRYKFQDHIEDLKKEKSPSYVKKSLNDILNSNEGATNFNEI